MEGIHMQKNSKKVLSACSVATLLIAGTTLPATVKADSSSNVTRIGGADRYETAAKVADAGWTSSSYAIVANGEGYADALCATPLAKAKNAPILLTYGNSLNQNVLDQLKNLKVEHVIVVGGTGVVPDSVVDEIKAQVSDVQRLGGQDRYETSVKIADALGTKPTKAVVASGEGYADALSAGPAAAINGIPILLTTQNTLPDAEANYLKANSGITATYVIGETGSVSDSVKDSLPSPTRLGGADRYETNIAVLKEFKSDFGFGNVYAALGNGPVGNEFADALTGGALAAKNKNPLIITGLSLSSATTDFLDENVPKNSTLTVLGGTGNISDSLADEIKDAFGKASTGGGGGSGSGDHDNGDNITEDIKDLTQYKNIVGRLQDDGDLNNSYFTIADDDSDSVNVKLKKDYENAGQVFNRLQEKYEETGTVDTDQIENFNSKLLKVYESLDEVKANGSTIQELLKNSNSKYISPENGTLNAEIVKEEIEAQGGNYTGDNSDDAFNRIKDDLKHNIEDYLDRNPSKDTTVNLTVEVDGVDKDITKVEKNGEDKDLFTSGSKAGDAAEQLVNLVFPDTEITGDYYIYINALGDDEDYIVVNVAQQ
jgi:putative cell wall-binding protein